MKLNEKLEKSNNKKIFFIIGLVAFVGLFVIAFFIKHLIDLIHLVDLLK